jgi:hypothetical protein
VKSLIEVLGGLYIVRLAGVTLLDRMMGVCKSNFSPWRWPDGWEAGVAHKGIKHGVLFGIRGGIEYPWYRDRPRRIGDGGEQMTNLIWTRILKSYN